MNTSPAEQASAAITDTNGIENGRTEADHNEVTHGPPQPSRYLERPAPRAKPLGFLRLMMILISSHIGVRSRANREEDFRRADGLQVFIAAVIYFLLVISMLILLVNMIID